MPELPWMLRLFMVNHPAEIPDPRHYTIPDPSTAWDVGAYEGTWAKKYRSVNRGPIECFEAHPDHCKQLKINMKDIPYVSVHCYGIGASTRDAVISSEGDGSTICGPHGDRVANIVAVAEAAVICGLPDIMKINVEGAEYEILDKMLQLDLVKHVRLFLIQFHTNVQDHADRYAAIATGLAKSHDLLVRRPFVWEVWERR